MLRILATLTLLVCATAAQAQSSLVPSVWKNQRGSEMQLHWWDPATQAIGGVYINRAPGYPHCAGTPYLLSGKSDGKKINFTVVWTNPVEDCKSTTVWNGRFRGNQIATRWLLTWSGGRKTGQDFFTRQ